MTIQFRGGLLPNDPTKPRLKFGAFVKSTYSPPASADYYSGVPAWGMLGNDQWGDCIFAENGHIAEQQTALGEHSEVTITTTEALAEYSRVTGFNPNAGPPGSNPTDQGSTVQAGLTDLYKNGIGGFKIAAFAQLDITNMNEVKTAVAQFGMVDLGVIVTQGMMDQFNAGQPWDGSGDQTELGGHCVGVAGYDSEYLYIVTWGTIQKATYGWWNKNVQEAWTLISTAWADDGKANDPEGVDLHGLGTEFAQLTGQPNPFPSPGPAPSPTPAPVPTPVPPPPGGSGCLPFSGVMAAAAEGERSKMSIGGWISNFFKKLVSGEPVVLGWLLNGGIAAVLAYVFHFGSTREAALATIVSAIVTIWTAAHTKPAHVTLITGALTTIATAMAAFGLHLSTNATAAVVAVISLLVSLLLRANVSPKN